MKLYRCEIMHDEEASEVIFKEYEVIGETPKGYYLKHNTFNGKVYNSKRWCPKEGINPFAFTTKQLALYSYVKRKKRHLRLLKHSIVVATKARDTAQSMYDTSVYTDNRFEHYSEEV